MNKQQKEILQSQLDNEKAVLKKLETNYQDALDEINSKIEILMARQDADMQHVIYQVQYQQALKTQVQSILETLQTKEFETLSEYLTHSYEDGFIGTMYDLQGQGIPLIFPLDQAQIVDAIQHETNLSASLYTALGHDIKDLQKKIAGEISRGIAGGQMYTEIARNVSNWARIPKNNAMRIARTEAHRIQCKAAMDAQNKAKEKGADVVKQWDASLDKRTRDSHRKVDGEIRELDESFSNGLKYPGDPNGRPEEVINCRCALLQRARWALGNNYTKWSEDAEVVIDDDGTTQFVNVDAKSYKEFKGYYKDITGQMTMNFDNKNAKRVRQNVQKINQKRSTAEGVFDTLNNTKVDSIRPHSVMKEMRKSEVGREALGYLESEGVPVHLCYGVDNPKNDYGVYDPFDDAILVYCDKTKTVLETTCTVIHETKHRMIGGTGTKAEEIECFKAEMLHKKGKLTHNDIDAIIKMVNKNYPDLK